MFGFLRSRPASPPAPKPCGQTQVGCFGKLPVQCEFIKHNIAHREAQALDQWVQGGVSLAARHGGAGTPGQAWIRHGIFGGTWEEAPVVFSIRPSADRSGRQYPFVVFQVLGAREREIWPGALALHAEGFLEAAVHLLSQPWSNEPLRTVLGWVDRIDAGPRRPAAGLPSELGAQEFLDGLYFGLSQAARLSHLNRAVELFRQVERRTAPRVGWGLRLPLEQAAPARSIQWWLRLAERIIGRGRWRPCFLWQPGTPTDDPGLLLFFRTPPAALLANLLQGRSLDATVVDPFHEPMPATDAGLGRLPSTSSELLESLVAGGRRPS